MADLSLVMSKATSEGCPHLRIAGKESGERLEDPKHLAVDGRVGLLVAPPCHLEGPAGVGTSHRVSSSAGQAADCSGETSLFAPHYVPIS